MTKILFIPFNNKMILIYPNRHFHMQNMLYQTNLEQIVYQLAYEWAPQIRVNGVAPGGTVTGLSGLDTLESASRRLDSEQRTVEMVAKASPLARAAEAEDHAGCYVLLASPRDGVNLNGTILVSDGGLISRMG